MSVFRPSLPPDNWTATRILFCRDGVSGAGTCPPGTSACSAIAVRAMKEGVVRPAATSSAPRLRRFRRVNVIGSSALRQLVGGQRHGQVEHAAHLLLGGLVIRRDHESTVCIQKVDQALARLGGRGAIHKKAEI